MNRSHDEQRRDEDERVPSDGDVVVFQPASQNPSGNEAAEAEVEHARHLVIVSDGRTWLPEWPHSRSSDALIHARASAAAASPDGAPVYPRAVLAAQRRPVGRLASDELRKIGTYGDGTGRG